MNVPEHLHSRVLETINMEADGADKRRLWSSIYRLVPYRDGPTWCVLLGPNIQDGIVGFGSTPVEALNNFEHAMYRGMGMAGRRPPSIEGDAASGGGEGMEQG